MKSKLSIILGFVMILTLVLLTGLVRADETADTPMSSAFTYQGQLIFNDEPYSGTCDFAFSLFDAPDGSQIGDPVRAENAPVDEGLFTVQIDFGTRDFTGDARWLQIGVRCPAGTGTYTTLSPKQELTATPYALYAGATSWSRLLGVPAGFSDDIDNDTTYDGRTGIVLEGTTFHADTDYLQRRVDETCPTGNAIRVINEDGTVTCQAVGSTGWSLTGNAATSPVTNYLGTSDNVALELRVNNNRALRLEPNTTSPNLIGGHFGNWLSSGVYGATIAGGGYSGQTNLVTDIFGSIGGGASNQAGDYAGTTGDRSYATISGGYNNEASGQYSWVGGGTSNTASGQYSSVGGGYSNHASGTAADPSGNSATVGGGFDNSAIGLASMVGGGESNLANATYSTIGGGYDNTASGTNSTVGGGIQNQATANSSTVGGGDTNIASGPYATIPGGNDNEAVGDFSFAAGNRAKANNDGCFVWGDSYNDDITCDTDNAWVTRSSGGVWFYTTGNKSHGVFLTANGGAWNTVSSRELKENFNALDATELLDRLATMPVTTWNYKAQDDSIIHVGLMADEFNSLIDGLGGEGMDHINSMDANGVALAAIQGLYTENQKLKAQVENLDSRVAELEELIESGNNARWSLATNLPWLLVFGLVAVGGNFAIRQRKEIAQ